MPAGLPRVARTLLCAAGLALAGTVAAQPSEASLKAAFLYNFALFTEWPAAAASFGICVLGKDALGEVLDALGRKEVGGRPVVVRRLSGAPIPAECNLLYLPPEETERGARVLASLSGRPVLVVVDGGRAGADGPLPAGAMLRLAIDHERVVFDAAPATAREAGLAISSKVLRLARSVK